MKNFRPIEQCAQFDVEAELLHREYRRQVPAALEAQLDAVALNGRDEPVAAAEQCLDDRRARHTDAQRGQLDVAVEPIAEVGDDLFADERFDPAGEYVTGDRQGDQHRGGGDADAKQPFLRSSCQRMPLREPCRADEDGSAGQMNITNYSQ